MAAPVIQFKRGLLADLPGLRAGEPGFTTDSYDFYIGLSSEVSSNKFFGSHRYWTRETSSTGSGLNLVEATANGSGYITLKSPDNLSGVGTYTLPDTSTITDGYFLKVSSDGTLSWDTSSGTGGSFTNSTFSGITSVSDSLNVSAGSDFSGITTFSNTGDNTLGDSNSGAVQIDGGLGVDKNVTVGGNLNVQGHSEFVGVVTFRGGTINLGDGNTDNINVGGEFVSDLTPNDDDTYDIGTGAQRWRNANFSGIVTTSAAAVTDLTSGRVVLAGAGGLLEDSANITFNGSTLTVDGEIVVNSGVSTISGFLDVNASANIQNSLEIQENLVVSGVTTTGTFVVSGTSGIGITGISTNTSLTEDSDDYLATQKAVKTYIDNLRDYVDAQVTVQDLDFAGDTGTGAVDIDSQTLTIAGTANEVETSASGQTITIGLPDTVVVGTAVSTPSLQVATIKHNNGTSAATIDTSGNLTAAQNLTVTGNLYVNGSTTQVNTSSMTVEDRTIELGQVDGSAPSSATTWDLGVLFNYNASGAKKSAVIWEHADSRFKFGSQVTDGGGTDNDSPQITVSNYAAIEIGSLWVNDCAGQSQVINCANGIRTLENITIDGGTF
jgi:hypothetical protein